MKALDGQIAQARESAIQEAEHAAAYQKEQSAAFNAAKHELYKRDRHGMHNLSNRANEVQGGLPKPALPGLRMPGVNYGNEGKGG